MSESRPLGSGEDGAFTEAEMHAYPRQACPRCGQVSVVQDFAAAPTYGTDRREYLPTFEHCTNPDCPAAQLSEREQASE